MQYHLIEELPEDFQLSDKERVVALTINASYSLDKQGIKYITLQDFYTQREICADAEEYLKEKLKWINDFDEIVREIHPGIARVGVNLPLLFFFNISSLVDQVVHTSRVISRFLDSVNPGKVLFYNSIQADDKFDQWLWFPFGESIHSRLIGKICTSRGIPCEKIVVKQPQSANNLESKYHSISKESLFLRVKSLIKSSVSFDLLEYIRYVRKQYSPSSPFKMFKRQKSIFIVKSNDFINDFCRDASSKGFRLYSQKGKVINKHNRLFPLKKRVYELNESFLSKDHPEMINQSLFANQPAIGGLMEWINEKCKVDVSSILVSRFSYLVDEIFPSALSLIKQYIEFYNKEKVDYALTYSLSLVEDFAAIAAARLSRNTKAVGFYHGSDAFEAKHRFFMEFSQFDLYFASTKPEVDHIKNLALHFRSTIPIVNEFPYFRRKLKLNKATIFKNNNRGSYQNKPIVLYLPIIRKIVSNYFIDSTLMNSMTFLYWHKALIEYFSKRQEFHFIWKGLIIHPLAFDTIPNIIKDKKITNISFHTDNIKNWLPKATKILCDAPSTAYFKIIFAQKPLFATINPKEQKVTQGMIKNLGMSLQMHNSIEEGIRNVECFLDGDPDKYTVQLPESDSNVLDILNYQDVINN